MTSNGYVEQVDIVLRPMCNDGTMAPNSIFRRWEDLSEEFSRATGKVLANRNTKQQLLDAGFEDVVEKTFKIPLGPWSIDDRYREIGKVRSLLLEMEIIYTDRLLLYSGSNITGSLECKDGSWLLRQGF